MHNYNYRLPSVVVIGGGAAGAAAGAECALIGFDTTIVDNQNELGGRYAGASPAELPKKFGYRKNNLKHTKVDKTPESARAHIQAAVAYSGAKSKLNSTATAASFDTDNGRWDVTVISGDNSETLSADVLVIATGTGTIDEIRDVNGRVLDLTDTHFHEGVEPLGLPNILVVDGPEPAITKFTERPLDVIEARADYCQRYTRQIERFGPGRWEVNKSFWSAPQVTRKNIIAALREFSAASHKHIPLETSDKKSRTSQRKVTTAGEAS